MMMMAGPKKVASEPTTAQLRKAADIARKAGVPPLAEKYDNVASAAEQKRKPKGDSIDLKTALKAGRAALDRTKEALKAGSPLATENEAKKPLVLTSHMLRTAAQKARIAHDPVSAEKHEMAARRLDMRGPREIASGTYIPASINQRRTKR